LVHRRAQTEFEIDKLLDRGKQQSGNDQQRQPQARLPLSSPKTQYQILNEEEMNDLLLKSVQLVPEKNIIIELLELAPGGASSGNFLFGKRSLLPNSEEPLLESNLKDLSIVPEMLMDSKMEFQSQNS